MAKITAIAIIFIETFRMQSNKNIILTMNLKNSILIIICIAMVSSRNFIQNQTEIEKSVVLSEIIFNYLTKYVSDDRFFVSIVCPSFKEQQLHFLHDFFVNLFNASTLSDFAHSVSDELYSTIRGRRRAFNLIMIDEYETLQ